MSSQETSGEIVRYSGLCDRIRRRLDTPPQFPPVTEEQLQAAEESIGFRLPAVLRLLYTQVADGGFGPGMDGLTSLAHGRWPWSLADCVTRTGWRFDPETEYTLIANPGANVICLHDQFPDGWLSLCDTGCGGGYDLDLYTGHIYEIDVCMIPNDVLDERLLNVVMQQDSVISAQFRSPSIEALLEEWLDPPLVPKAAPARTDQRSLCLGLAGPHGIAHVGYASGGNDEYEDDVQPQQNIEDLMDSSDWLWYQSQPPADADD